MPTNPDVREEHELVSLIVGLFAISGLFFITVVAIVLPAGLGLIFGVAELVLAWRVAPPPGARSLRIVAGLMGTVAVAWSVVRFFVT